MTVLELIDKRPWFTLVFTVIVWWPFCIAFAALAKRGERK
jgi:hypothetical protein